MIHKMGRPVSRTRRTLVAMLYHINAMANTKADKISIADSDAINTIIAIVPIITIAMQAQYSERVATPLKLKYFL